MFRINHILKKPEDILPWGNSLHWFGLSDGLLWIETDDGCIYEYTTEHMTLDDDKTRYNDYQLERFVQDFSYVFQMISRSVPREIYEVAEKFIDMIFKWKELHEDDDDDSYDDFYFNEFCTLYDVFGLRGIDSMHLIDGPNIFFIRCESMIKIIWVSDDTDGRWTSPSGFHVMNYDEFVSESERFLNSYLDDMEAMVNRLLVHPLENVDIDYERLAKDLKDRKLVLSQAMKELHGDNEPDMNIMPLFRKMLNEIS